MTTSADELREEVRRKYAEAARAAAAGDRAGCGGGSCCADGAAEGDFGEALYAAEERGELPETAVLASLGCGNPTAVAELREGETVLDLGSGGGIDVILSAKRVGPTGRAFGLEPADRIDFETFTLIYLSNSESAFEVELTVNKGRTEPR